MKPLVARKKSAAQPESNEANGQDKKGKDKYVKQVDKSKDKRALKRVYKEALTQAYKEVLKKVDKDGGLPAEQHSSNGSDSVKNIEIEFDDIESRILAFPVSEGIYMQIVGVENRALFTVYPIKGIRPNFSWYSDDSNLGTLIAYDFDENRSATLQKDVGHFVLAHDNQTLYYKARKRIRAVDALEKLPGEGREPASASGSGRSSGWIDIARAQVMVSPKLEWTQMYSEAWRLQKEQFWDESMSGIDWDLVYKRYSVLLPRVRTRHEVSDLIWEMQGELGTSHAYEMGGDYRRSLHYHQGFLGVDVAWDAKRKGYRIEKILKGDSWSPEASSPLIRPGLNIAQGDVIVSINGTPVSKELTVDQLLLNQQSMEVSIGILGKDKSKRNVVVETLRTERPLRYRDWVESNRKSVHEATKGRIGYVHIPDMGPWGFAEFHRSYLSEVNKDGLIVDVRYNRGGHVSPLLLEKLLRKRVGYDVSRWAPSMPYPPESVAGPMVAITNQFAGSDGDIFSHCFKLYKLGPLVGKRTWGGVIGIWPRHRLVDGTVTTQPEYSFWFNDVGWGIENYGTKPDHEVDIPPHDFIAKKDPQMEKALSLIHELLKANPVMLPDFSNRPLLPLPEQLLKEPKRQAVKGPSKKSASNGTSKSTTGGTTRKGPAAKVRAGAAQAAKKTGRPAAGARPAKGKSSRPAGSR